MSKLWYMGFSSVRPHWVATAYFDKGLSYRQCWQLWKARAAYTANNLDPPKIGNLAVERGLVSRDTAEQIETQREYYAKLGQTLPDPISLPPRMDRLKRFATPSGVFAAVLSCALLVWITIEWKGDLTIIGSAASIVALAWVVVPIIASRWFPRSIPLYRPLRWTALIAVPLALGYCLYIAYELAVLANRAAEEGPIAVSTVVSQDTLAQIESLWFRCWTGGAVAGMGLATYLAVSSFRHREIWYLECRIFFTQALVARGRTIIEELKRSPAAKAAPLSGVQELLDLTAKTITLNPWVHELSQLGKLVGKTAGGVSLWYLEPNDTDPNKFTHFSIVAISAPGASKEGVNCFEQLKNGHHPVRYNEDVYRKKIAHYTRSDGTLDKRGFREDPDHDNFISLAGFVYARQQSEMTGKAEECLALNTHHWKALSPVPTDRKVRRWLDFRSVAAFAVQGKGDRPLGALLAFKNVPNGFTPPDHDVLLTTSRLLGVIRDW